MQVISTLNSLPLPPSISLEENSCSWGNNIWISRNSITSYPLQNCADSHKQGTIQETEATFLFLLSVSPKYLSFKMIVWLDISTLMTDKRRYASEIYGFFEAVVPPFPPYTPSFPLSYEHMYKQWIAAGTLTQKASWLLFDLLLLPLN